MKTAYKLLLFLTLAFLSLNIAAAEEPYRVEEYLLNRDGMKIYGELFIPDGDAPFPLVILSHGYGGSHNDLIKYAEMFARNGLAAYVFDFIGGGSG